MYAPRFIRKQQVYVSRIHRLHRPHICICYFHIFCFFCQRCSYENSDRPKNGSLPYCDLLVPHKHQNLLIKTCWSWFGHKSKLRITRLQRICESEPYLVNTAVTTRPPPKPCAVLHIKVQWSERLKNAAVTYKPIRAKCL